MGGAGGHAERSDSGASAAKDNGLYCLALLARFHDKAAEPAQLAHALGLNQQADPDDLIRAAKLIDLKARWTDVALPVQNEVVQAVQTSTSSDTAAALSRLPLPCLIQLWQPLARYSGDSNKQVDQAEHAADIDEELSTHHQQPGYAILARIEGERALLHDPISDRPVVLTLAQLAQASAPSGTSTGATQSSTFAGAAKSAVSHNPPTAKLMLVTSRASLAKELARFDFSWFIPALVKYRKLISEALVASLALQLFALVTPLFFQVVMDKVLAHKGISTLTVIGIGLCVTVVFESVLSALRNYVFSHTTSRIDVELGARLFRHLLALPLAYFEARRVGDSVARVRELENIRQFLTGSALTSLLDLLFTFVFLALLFWYSIPLACIVLVSLPLYGLIMGLAMPTFRKRLDEKFARGAENQAFLVEAVSNIQTLKAGALEPQATRRWEQQLAAYVAASFRVIRLSTVAGEGIQLTSKLVTVAILWMGAYQVMDGEMTVGSLVAFNMLAGRVAQPVLRLAQLWQELQQTGVSMARLADILNTRTEAGPSPRAQPAIRGAIRFDSVRFRYRPDGQEILRGISLDIAAGEVVGVVGRSGSGKSTLAKLVQRLYVPERGRVLIDGADLALADPAGLRRQIGVVLQDNRLFAASIRENIAIADPGAPLELVMAAAKQAGAHEFILELPEGYDTPVGEQGASLSGGQRQRIAIARALLTNPRILILDEATSALDYESERIVHDNMRFIAKGRTVIIIAHRLSAVRDAHRIVVMESGEIVEMGGHADLLAQNGRYARLHAMQSG